MHSQRNSSTKGWTQQRRDNNSKTTAAQSPFWNPGGHLQHRNLSKTGTRVIALSLLSSISCAAADHGDSNDVVGFSVDRLLGSFQQVGAFNVQHPAREDASNDTNDVVRGNCGLSTVIGPWVPSTLAQSVIHSLSQSVSLSPILLVTFGGTGTPGGSLRNDDLGVLDYMTSREPSKKFSLKR